MNTDAQLLKYYSDKFPDDSPVSLKEMEILLPKIKNNDDDAKNRVIGANIGLIVNLATTKFTTIPLDDLIQEGILGVFDALDKYDLDKRTKFSTFAYPYINHRISEYKAAFSGAVNIPSRHRKLISRIIKLRTEADRELSVEELASMLHLQPRTVVTLIEEMHLLKGSQYTNSDDPRVLMCFEQDERIDTNSGLDAILSSLTPKEEYVIRFRFGIGTGKGMTKIRSFKEIASIFQVSDQQARIILDNALKKVGDLPEIQMYNR